MPLSDLLGAVPGLILFGLIPGFALATLAAPRWHWWERLAAAPAFSAGVAGVVGLAYHDLHIVFRPLTVVPVIVLLAAAAAWRSRRTHGQSKVGPVATRAVTQRVIAAALLAGVAGAVVLASGLRGSPLPIERDSAIHGAVAVAIAATGDVLPAVPEPADSSAWIRLRTGLEAQAALVADIGGPDPARALMPLTLLAVLLLPLAITALAWETSRSAAVGAVAAGIALLSAYPAWPVTFGEMPLVVTTGIVVPLVLGAWRCVRGERPRDAVAMVSVAVAANWAVHGTEFLTAAVIGGPLVLGAVWVGRHSGAPARLVGLLAAAAATAIAVTELTGSPPLPTPTSPVGGGVPLLETSDFGALVGHRSFGTALNELTGFQPTWQLIAALAVLGTAAAILRRRMLWAVIAEVAVLAIYIDTVSVGSLRSTWVRLYPWSTDDRVMDMQLFALAPLAAFGVVSLGEWLVARRTTPVYRLAPACAAAAAAMLGLAHAGAIYGEAVADHPVITAADVSAMREMSARLPVNAVVLSNDMDGGVWISALTRQELFMSWPYLRGHPDDARVRALSSACTDASAPDPALFSGIDAVYVGARQLPDVAPWDATCIARVPWLHVIVEQSGAGGRAVVFRVDHAVTAGRP